MSARRPAPTALLAVAALAACTGAPDETSFDASAGTVDVEVLGDGFVRCGGRRIPLEAAVLELRQRTRRMTPDELGRFVVRLRLRPGIVDGAAAENARRGLSRLIDELDIMDVGQVVYL